jgi:undecaprenyl-diphosphatase
MNFIHILILGIVQGAAELLPVSSSAHVIVAEKLMGLDPSSPENVFLLLMLHTGTMFAVIVYFWNSWLDHYFSDAKKLSETAKHIALATIVTGVVGLGLKFIIEKVVLHGGPKAEVEQLFSNLPLIGGALFAAGVLIFFAGSSEERWPASGKIDQTNALLIGLVQAFCLPFRGFSRSGATISTGLLLGVERREVEEFSFALAVVLTPPLVAMEFLKLIKEHPEITHGSQLISLLEPGLVGLVCAFIAGYLALKLLSSLLEAGRWKYFGYYCVAASLVVFALAYAEPSSGKSVKWESGYISPAPETPAVVAPTNPYPPAPTPMAPVTNITPAPPAPIPTFDTSSPATMVPASAHQPPAPVTNAAPANETDAATKAALEQMRDSAPSPATNATPATN